MAVRDQGSLHSLHNPLTGGGEAVSLKCQPRSTPGRFLVLICVGASVDLRAIVRLEGSPDVKHPMAPGIEREIFRLAA
jgi:hypothetical protein